MRSSVFAPRVRRWWGLVAVLWSTGHCATERRAPALSAEGYWTPPATGDLPARALPTPLCEPRTVFRYHAGTPLPGRPALGADGSLCLATAEGLVQRLGPTGGFEWSYTLPFGAAGGPALSRRGVCFVGTAGRRFHALTRHPTERWERRHLPRPGGDLVAKPGGGFSYLSETGRLHVYSASGDDLLHARRGGGSAGPVWVERFAALIGTREGQLWEFRAGRPHVVARLGEPISHIVWDGELVYSVAGETLVAFDRNYRKLWTQEGVWSVAPVSGGNGGVTAATRGGEALVLSRTGGVVAAYPIADLATAPVLTPEGFVFAPLESGAVAIVTPEGQSVVTGVLSDAPFWTPIFDQPRARVVLASGSGEVVAFPAGARNPCHGSPLGRAP